MARGKIVAVLLAGAGLAGVLLWRRRARGKERVDLYFGDGSMVSFASGTREASRMLPLAQDVVAAANGHAPR